jgi:uncharacterized protein YdbL (DUF1318 family)
MPEAAFPFTVRFHRLRLLPLLLFFALAGPVSAQDTEAALKERFLERLPVLDELRAQGRIGENNQGLLTIRVPELPTKQQQVVEAENRDRQLLYTRLAARLDLSPEASAASVPRRSPSGPVRVSGCRMPAASGTRNPDTARAQKPTRLPAGRDRLRQGPDPAGGTRHEKGYQSAGRRMVSGAAWFLPATL